MSVRRSMPRDQRDQRGGVRGVQRGQGSDLADNPGHIKTNDRATDHSWNLKVWERG